MPVTHRGGYPHVWRESVGNAAPRKHGFPFWSNYLQVKVDAACKLYFTQEAADLDQEYILVNPASAAEPHGFEGPIEVEGVWLRGVAGAVNVELLAYQRRG